MAVLSAQDIKAQILKDIQSDEVAEYPTQIVANADKHIEIGTAIKRMVTTSGWKILEYWLINQIDINGLLNVSESELSRLRAEAKAFARILVQVESWQLMADRLQKQIDKQKQEKSKEVL